MSEQGEKRDDLPGVVVSDGTVSRGRGSSEGKALRSDRLGVKPGDWRRRSKNRRARGRNALAAATPASMIRSLRLKFVVASMMAVTLVVTATFATICYLDYRQSVNEVYDQLQLAVDSAFGPGRGHGWDRWNTGEAPDMVLPEGENPISPNFYDSNDSGGAEDNEDDRPLPPQIGGGRHEGPAIPVAVFFVDSSGQAAVALSQSTASLSSTVLKDALGQLAEAGEFSPVETAAAAPGGNPDADVQRGLLSSQGLFYLVHPLEDGFLVAFADEGNASSWETLAIMLAGIGLLVLAVFLVASIFFARWALRPVERAWNQQQQFIADASHELKTPLTVILANTSILKSRPQETMANQAQWVESTQVEAERMQGLVNDMLDLARPQQTPGLGGSGGVTDAGLADANASVDMSDLVEGEVLQFEAVAFERGIQLDSRVEEGLEVQGSADRLKRLTAILLDNACKYAEPAPDGVSQALPGASLRGAMSADEPSDESGPLAEDGFTEKDGRPSEDDVHIPGTAAGSPACIQVTLEKEGRDARLTVANTGPAIPAEDLPHLFDRFYRVDKSRTKQAPAVTLPLGSQRPGGFGLGLAIARDIVQAHGGTIAVESNAEAGTVFTAELPLA